MYRARSLLQKIGRDLIRMNAAMSWTMRSVRLSQASALRLQTTCSQPTCGPPRNRQHYHLTNTRDHQFHFWLRSVAPAAGLRTLLSVAGRTRLLDPCRRCREADRQQLSTVVLSSHVADADSPGDQPSVGPGALPHTPPCAWARGYFDGLTGPVAEGGTGRRNKT